MSQVVFFQIIKKYMWQLYAFLLKTDGLHEKWLMFRKGISYLSENAIYFLS